MTKPYDFDCECKGTQGRQSDVMLNGEMHNIYEAVRHLVDVPEKKESTPVAKHRGALWLDQRTNQLYTWVGSSYKHDRVRNGWLPVFADKFQMFDEMLSSTPSGSPVRGQLWLYNGILMYFDGSTWQPVRAVEHPESQFNTAFFSDFQLTSPLNRLGSVVISDVELEAFLELQRRYFEDDIDTRDNGDATVDKRWDWGDFNGRSIHTVGFDIEDITYQYLIPNIKVDRIFIDDRHDTSYVQQNSSVIQYKRSYMIDEQERFVDGTPLTTHVKVPSLIHVNPGKLTNIRKRLFKVDRSNPKICCPALNTEYYGFCSNDIHGHFLRPSKAAAQKVKDHQELMKTIEGKNKEVLDQQLLDYGYDINSLFIEGLAKDDGDYAVTPDGIFLSNNATQQYDFILAITFEFSWLNATGQLRQGDNRDGSCSYYLPNRLGSINIFINGFDYESNYFVWDYKNQVVTVAEDISDKEKYDIAALGVFTHEYGFIRDINISVTDNVSYITTVNKFRHPLVFINGQALLRSEWHYYDRNTASVTEEVGNTFQVSGVRSDMCWTIIDMQKEEDVINPVTGLKTGTTVTDICIEENGVIPRTEFTTDINGNIAISLGNRTISYEDSTEADARSYYKTPKIVLFIDGLMIKREDVKYDYTNKCITCNGLRIGQQYIILDDAAGNLYTENMENGIWPAISVGKIDETLVYHNGYLLGENKAYRFDGAKETAASSAMHGEIRAFNNEADWCIFDAETLSWITVTSSSSSLSNLADDVKSFSNSYINTKSAVAISDKVSNTNEDKVIVYGYQLANFIENPIVPVTCWLHLNDSGTVFLKEAGYDEAFRKVVKADQAMAVYYHRLDPGNSDLVANYSESKWAYAYFMMRNYGYWLSERNANDNYKFSETTTDAEKVAAYGADSRKHPDQYADYLEGYFYDGVYMRHKSDEDEYIKLRDVALGTKWVNKMFLGRDFNPVYDYLMVWINGVRQYPDIHYTFEPVYDTDGDYSTLKGYNLILGHVDDSGELQETVNENGFITVPRGDGNTVKEDFDKEPLTGILTYVIQRAGKDTSKACRYIVLDNRNMVQGYQNVYSTKNRSDKVIDSESLTRDTSFDFSLYPGSVTVYADGRRLPKEAYTVLDNYTIVIRDTMPWCGADRYPEEHYIDHNKNLSSFRHLQPEQLLVEVREDSIWTEKTIDLPDRFTGGFYVYDNGVNLPHSILDTQDTIMIFVDGLYYGSTPNDGYVIDKTKSIISVRDGSIINALIADDVISYMDSISDISDIRLSEYEVYTRRQNSKVKHQITFEWR